MRFTISIGPTTGNKNERNKMKKQKTDLYPSNAQSLLHGVYCFHLEGDSLTLIYTDGETETARIGKDDADAFHAYAAYQQGEGAKVEEPNAFSLVSAVQEQRDA